MLRHHVLRAILPAVLGSLAVACGASSETSATSPSNAPASGPPPFQVRVVGHGPPLLLVPGLASPGAVWDDVVTHYQDRYTCHVFSLAGFAGVAPRKAPFLASERKALESYVHEQKLVKPAIMGHSLGGVLALAIAEDEPTLLGPIVIVDSLPFLPAARDPHATAESTRDGAAAMRDKLLYASPEDRHHFQEMSARMLVTKPEDVDRVAGWSMKSDVDTVGNALYDVMTTDLRPQLGRIQSPTLVLGTWVGYAPAQTREETLRVFEAQYAGVGGVKVLLADHARHFVMLDDPGELFRVSDAFLAATASAHPTVD